MHQAAILHEKLMRAVATGNEEISAKAANGLVDYFVEFTRKALDIN